MEANKKYRYIMTTRKTTLKNIVSGYAVRSEHLIYILNSKSIGKEHLDFITEGLMKKTVVSFRDSVES